jgi:hypothetical protein
MPTPFPTPPPRRTTQRRASAHPPWPPGDGLRLDSGGEFRHRSRDVDRPPPIPPPPARTRATHRHGSTYAPVAHT